MQPGDYGSDVFANIFFATQGLLRTTFLEIIHFNKSTSFNSLCFSSAAVSQPLAPGIVWVTVLLATRRRADAVVP